MVIKLLEIIVQTGTRNLHSKHDRIRMKSFLRTWNASLLMCQSWAGCSGLSLLPLFWVLNFVSYQGKRSCTSFSRMWLALWRKANFSHFWFMSCRRSLSAFPAVLSIFHEPQCAWEEVLPTQLLGPLTVSCLCACFCLQLLSSKRGSYALEFMFNSNTPGGAMQSSVALGTSVLLILCEVGNDSILLDSVVLCSSCYVELVSIFWVDEFQNKADGFVVLNSESQPMLNMLLMYQAY